jgi:dTDP-4-amino-4,6-dideoxygalactose transaminase
MMDLQAALGIHQLARLETAWKRRAEIWDTYQGVFANAPVGLPAPPAPDTRHAYHLYTLLVDEARAGISRDAFLEGMTAQKIGVGVHYRSLAEHPYYREHLGWRPEEWPHALRLGQQTVSIPLSAALGPADVADVTSAVKKLLRI